MCSTEESRTIGRRDFLKLGAAGIGSAALLGSFGAGSVLASPASLRREHEAAAEEYDVPIELLLAMGYVNTLWEMPPPSVSDYDPGDLHGRGEYGIMQLARNPARDTLGRAASLTNLPESELKTDLTANIRGGAALLSEIQGREKPDGVNGWQKAVAEYGGGALYAKEVYEALDKGASLETSTGERVSLAPQRVEIPQIYEAQGAEDYPPARWSGADRSNFTASRRERTYNINRIVIHVVEGSASSAVRWFKEPIANVSAHYVTSRSGAVIQCVLEKHIAWHAGNWWYNTHSIGIEHAGYGSNPKHLDNSNVPGLGATLGLPLPPLQNTRGRKTHSLAPQGKLHPVSGASLRYQALFEVSPALQVAYRVGISGIRGRTNR